MNKPIIFSFFSGSGFLDLGFEKNDFNIAFVNENHIPFLDAYKYTRENMGDSTPEFGFFSDGIENFTTSEGKVHLKSLVEKAKKSNIVGFIGGPPCPDFSVGGKNKGKNGENGKLTRVYIETIINSEPDFFIFENVKGLWRTKRHREFYDEMKNKLQNSGYLLTDRLTNCIEFGAPQDRDRILLFGIKNKLVPNLTSSLSLQEQFEWEKYMKYNKEEALNKNIWPDVDDYEVDSSRKIPNNINGLHKLTVQYWFEKNDVYNHKNSKHHFIPRAGLAKMKIIKEGDDSKKSYKRLHRWRYSPTAAYGNNEVHLHPYKDRRISAAEALAIQSLPKDFVLPDNMTLSNMFKTIGNGVPFLASVGLAKTVYNFLNKNHLLS